MGADAAGLVPDLVRIDVRAADRAALLEAITAEMEKEGLIPRASEALSKLLDREDLQSTALGGGVAFPHARVRSCAVPRLAVLRLSQGVDYEAADGLPVDLVFLLVGPPEEPAVHLRVMAKVARLLQREGVISALRRMPDEASFRKRIEQELG